MKTHLTAILLIFISFTGFAQMETSNWYFGRYAGLKFLPDGTTIPLSDGQMNTYEGCTAISDYNGNLLFYSDGRTIWDRNHVIMPNGNYNAGTGLLGDPSSTQSGIVVPKKGHPNIYYVFTVDEPHNENTATYPNPFPGPYEDGNTIPDEDDGLNNGLNYSVIDLSVTGSNGSIGNVVTRNVHLVTYDPNSTADLKYKCSEKITAVKDAVGTGYWVLTHFKNSFYAFHVDANGVNETPVITTIDPMVTTQGYRRNAIGYLKISPNGKKIAITHSERGAVPGGTSNTGVVYLYDFDAATGTVSNPVKLRDMGAYGVEFSPQSKKLYASYDSGISQYDLESGDIPGSEIIMANAKGKALQIGPNYKIYIAPLAENYLNVINNPDEDYPLCDYVTAGQPLAQGKKAAFGLPPFIASYFDVSILARYACLGETTLFELDPPIDFDSIEWDFGDGSPLSTDTSPSHTYANPGIYEVNVTVTRGIDIQYISRDITIALVPVAYAAGNLETCDMDNDGIAVFDLTPNTAAILGTQNPDDYEILYFASQQNADSNINSLNSTVYSNVSNPQTLYARIQHKLSPDCYDTTSFVVTAMATPDIETLHTEALCKNAVEPILIDAGTSNPQYQYFWSTGETSPSIMVNEPGIYSVIVTHSNGCPKIRTVSVITSDIATIQSVDVTDLTDNNTVAVNIIPDANIHTTYLYSLDQPNGPYQQSNIFEDVTPGVHTAYVYDENGCGVASKEFAVLSIPKFFTPNGDGINDTWDIVGMNYKFHQNSTIYIYDRYGKLLARLDPKGTGWNGNYRGRPLPSTDYWYVLVLEDGRTVKGHFSMIR